MKNLICKTCGKPFQSIRKRAYCCPAHRQSTPATVATRHERALTRTAAAAEYRQRRAAGESYAEIAASVGLSRQYVYLIASHY
jgi:predicted amidophosphoribosyltransferase